MLTITIDGLQDLCIVARKIVLPATISVLVYWSFGLCWKFFFNWAAYVSQFATCNAFPLLTDNDGPVILINRTANKRYPRFCYVCWKIDKRLCIAHVSLFHDLFLLTKTAPLKHDAWFRVLSWHPLIYDISSKRFKSPRVCELMNLRDLWTIRLGQHRRAMRDCKSKWMTGVELVNSFKLA